MFKSLHLVSMNVTLFGKSHCRYNQDEVTLEQGRLTYDWCFCEKKKRDKAEGRIPGKDEKYPVANKRKPRTASHHQNLRTGKEDFFPQSSERTRHRQHPDFRLLKSRTVQNNSCFQATLSPIICYSSPRKPIQKFTQANRVI